MMEIIITENDWDETKLVITDNDNIYLVKDNDGHSFVAKVNDYKMKDILSIHSPKPNLEYTKTYNYQKTILEIEKGDE